MDKKFVIIIKEDERQIKEEEYLLQQKLVETKMKERRLRLKKGKKLCLQTFIVIAVLLGLGITGFAALHFCFKANDIVDNTINDPKNYLNAEKSGIRKSRPNRDHDIVPKGRPYINEFVSPFYGFFKDSNTGAENYDTKANKFVQNPPQMEFFEMKRDGELLDKDYGLIVIEKNHKKTNKSLILQYSKFNKQCFGSSDYCLIGNGSVNQMTYLNFNKFKKPFDEEDEEEEEIDGLSTDFLLLIIKDVEEFEDEWEIEKINNVKYFVSAYMKNFFKYHTVNAVFIGKYDDGDSAWIKELKEKLNIHPIQFINEYNKGYSFCDKKWITNTELSQNAVNFCNSVPSTPVTKFVVRPSDNLEEDLDQYTACKDVEIIQWECSSEIKEKKGNETNRLTRQAPANGQSDFSECKLHWKMKLKENDKINFEIIETKTPATGIITEVKYYGVFARKRNPKEPIEGFMVKSPAFQEIFGSEYHFVHAQQVRSTAIAESSTIKKTTANCVNSEKKTDRKRCNDGSDLGVCSPEKVIHLDTTFCQPGSDVVYFDKTGKRRTRKIHTVTFRDHFNNRIERLTAICNFKGFDNTYAATSIATLKEIHIQQCIPSTSEKIICPSDSPREVQEIPILAFNGVNDPNFIGGDDADCLNPGPILNQNQDIDGDILENENERFDEATVSGTTLDSLRFSYEGVEFPQLDSNGKFISTALHEFPPIPNSPTKQIAADYVKNILNIIFPTTNIQRSVYTYLVVPANIEPINLKLSDILYIGSSNNYCHRFFSHIETTFAEYIKTNGAVKILVFVESNIAQALQYESLLLMLQYQLGLDNLMNKINSSSYSSIFTDMRWLPNHPFNNIFVQGLQQMMEVALMTEGLQSDTLIDISQCDKYKRRLQSNNIVNIPLIESDIPPEQVLERMNGILGLIFPNTKFQRKCTSYIILPKGLASNSEKFKFTKYVGRSIDFITKFFKHFWRDDFIQYPPPNSEWVVLKYYEGFISSCYEIEALFQRLYKRAGVDSLANQVVEPLVSYEIFEGASIDDNLLNLLGRYFQQLLTAAFGTGVEITKTDAAQFANFKEQHFLQMLKIVNLPVYTKYYEMKNLIAKKYYENNKDKIKLKSKLNYEKNKESILEDRKDYRIKNKESIQIQKKKYYERNFDKISAREKLYRDNKKMQKDNNN